MLLEKPFDISSDRQMLTPSDLLRAHAAVIRLNSGDLSAEAELEAAFEIGIAFFLRRGGSYRKESGRQIISAIAQQAVELRILNGREAAAAVVRAVRAIRREPVVDNNATTAALVRRIEHLPSVEREVLVRLFAMGESIESICRALRIDRIELLAILSRSRKSSGSAGSLIRKEESAA